MRNSKVKLVKKLVSVSLAVMFLGSNINFAALAADNWSEVQSAVSGMQGTSGTVELNNDMETNGQALNLGAPPVPSSLTINGKNHTVTATNHASGNGYIINNGTNLTINQTNFKDGNVTDANGGAIQNTAGLTVNGTSETKAVFSNNVVQGYGGAVANTGSGVASFDNVKFEGNAANGTNNQGFGGAIYNETTADGSLTITNSEFESNTAQSYGGAFANLAGEVDIVHTDFTANSVSAGDGGAIVNWANTEISGGSTFSGNTATANGGAIINGSVSNFTQDANLTIRDTLFENNYAPTVGGAIINRGNTNDHVNTLTIGEGTRFVNNGYGWNTGSSSYNYTMSGGAISNESPTVAGGTNPILNIQGSANNKVEFTGNMASSNGGAIRNAGIATINNATFTENGFHQDRTTTSGGAVYNSVNTFGAAGNTEYSAGRITISNSEFTNNRATNGGAVYNNNGTATIINSNFSGNTSTNADRGGGAIYAGAGSTTTLRAENAEMNVGTSESVANVTDSISLNGATGNEVTLNLEANNGTLNINSMVIGTEDAGTDENLANINVNGNGVGSVNVNGDAKVQYSNIAMNTGGTLHFAKDTGLDVSNALNFNGGTLNMLNGVVSDLQVKSIDVNANSNLFVDVDLANQRMDNFLKGDGTNNINQVGSIADGTFLNIAGMKSISEAGEDGATILFTDIDNLIGHVSSNGSKVIESPKYKYSVEQITVPTTGGSGMAQSWDPGEYFHFERIGDSDSVIAAPVAAQAAFLIMDNLYRQSFANMDMVTLMTPEQRLAWKMRNKYASAAKGYHTGVYAPNIIPEERDGWYFRPFTNFENIPLKNGPRVSNVSYGTLIGGESDLIDLGHGWDGNFSVFAAYHGSHQAYNGVGIWQNGGTLGAVGTAYKGNFWTGLTANIGASAAEASTMWGNDGFPILMTGAAWKSGYNWGLLNNKLVIQPSYMMSYTFVNVFDFTNSAGVRITQDPLHAIEIIPGLRIIGNLKNGWQPYIGLNMTWNIMDKTKFYADDVALTPLSVKPYFEYGVGLQKRCGDRFTGFGQAMLRNGGRNGIAFTLGFRWALGH